MVGDSATGAPETGATITNFDLQYTRTGEAPAAKVDATALGATNSAHADNKMIELDSTSSPGLYRVDWPDAAFALGATGVTLVVTQTGFHPAVEEITLGDPFVPASSAVSTPPKASPNGFTITSGENEVNTEDSTFAKDGVTHDIEAVTDGTEKIEVYYEFSVGGDGLASGITATIQLDKGTGAGKNLTVWAYNWGTPGWDQIGTLDSDTSLADAEYQLITAHTGTGANLGLVRIRFLTGSVALVGTTTLKTDQILVDYVIVPRSVGYSNGRIYIDTNASNTNTEDFVDGTADNPVSTITAAFTLAASLGMRDFHVINGSSITLAATASTYSFFGNNWTLALGGQTMVGIHVEGADVSGVMAGAGDNQSFRNCDMGTCSLIAHTHLESCRISGTQTLIEAGDIWLDSCHSGVTGSTAPILDFGGALGSSNVHVRDYFGGLQLENMGDAGTDTLNFEGMANLIEGTCTSGTVTIRGIISTSGITNLTLTEVARVAPDQINAACDTALLDINLDHLMKTPVASNPDMTPEVADGTVLSNIMSKTSDTSTFAVATDSLEAIRDRGDAAWSSDSVPVTRLVDTTIQAGSTASLLIALAADLPGAGADDTDDIYNGAMVLARDVNSGNKPNIRLVSVYTASTNTFTLDAALDFTPEVGVDTFEVWADPGAAILVEILKLSTGFGASAPDNLISHLRAMMSKAATVPSGVGTYTPSTDSLEVLGEAATAIQGSGFATGTDSLKAIRDAITDLVAPLVVSASGTLSGVGFLSECVSLIRKATDEPDTGPKYPDADLIEYIHSAFDQVLASINVETDHPILVRYEVPVVQGTQEYLLPCNMAEIWRIAKIDLDTGIPTHEVWPTNPYTFRGDGFMVEGNILRFQHLNRTAETLEVLYVAAGDVSIHTATAAAGAADSITFPASPTDGTLDIRPHAYAGYTVRTLSGTGAGQERIASAYNTATRVVTLRPDWTTAPDDTTVYEVLPQYSRLIKHVVACYASLDVLANEAKSERRAEIERQLQRKMSALKMMLAKKVHRFGTQGPGVDTYDNTDLWPILP
jgi:hypothetical protein